MTALSYAVLAALAVTSYGKRVAIDQHFSTFLDAGSYSNVAAEMAEHLRKLGDNEPHHVCVTGNQAAVAVNTFVLQGTGQSIKDYAMVSKISQAGCTVQEAQVGNTLFTISSSLPDKCQARWQAHTKSCDVLLHAHSGPNCHDLYKFRLGNMQCNKDLIVVSDDQELSSCLAAKMDKHGAQNKACEGREEWLSARSQQVGADATKAMKIALERNAHQIRRKFESNEGIDSSATLRTKILSAYTNQEYSAVEDDMLKLTQNLPRSGGALAEVFKSIKEKRGTLGVKAIIMDMGSDTIKAGFAGEDKPETNIPTLVARDDKDGTAVGMPGMSGGGDLFGDDAARTDSTFLRSHKVNRPIGGPNSISGGIVNNWRDMQDLWDHIFSTELRVSSEDYLVHLTEPPANPKANREKTTQIMFETFNVPKLYISIAPVLALYASGRTTGLVVDSGEGVTHTVPIYEGYALPHAVNRLDAAGGDLTDFLAEKLKDKGVADRATIRDIKEKKCYVAEENYEAEIAKGAADEIGYELSNGQKIYLGSERFSVPEAMFRPQEFTKAWNIMIPFYTVKPPEKEVEKIGIHEAALKTIQDCDIDIRMDLYENIVISGGNTKFPGFAKRLQNEMKAKAPSEVKERVEVDFDEECDDASCDPMYNKWSGGSILSSLSTFQNMWITRDEYDESGPAIVHKKCAT